MMLNWIKRNVIRTTPIVHQDLKWGKEAFKIKIGGSVSFGLVWPTGRRTGVPEITIDDERPWYPTGKYFQLGMRALSLPLKLHITIIYVSNLCCLITKLYFSYVKLFGVIYLPKHFSNIWSMNDILAGRCILLLLIAKPKHCPRIQ